MIVKVQKKNAVRGRTVFIVLFALILCAAAAAGMILADVSDIDIGVEKRTVEISGGVGVSEVAKQLSDEEIIKYPLVFRMMSRMGGYDSNIKPGMLNIEDKMSYKEILTRLCSDNRMTNRLVIPEGFEQKQIAARLNEQGFCTEDEFYAALNDDYGYDFLNGLTGNKLEGYLYPDTYIISEGASAHDIIDMMLSEFNTVFTGEYRAKAQEMNMSINDIITMASIIERETDRDDERAKVAGVFYNRIKKNMNLQSCATVQYILGERKPVLSIEDTQIESPYNTYIHSGLPIGPIANPGIECIKAALYPEDTEYLYFVADENGGHIFSKTYEEHLAAMNGAAQ